MKIKKLISEFNLLTRTQKITVVLSLLLLILSLTQPAFYIDREENPAAWAQSAMLFFFGWIFPLGGGIVPFLFWCANPLYILSLIKIIKKKKSGFLLILIATLIAFGFSQMNEITASSSGGLSEITSLELGYKLWLSSFIVLTLGTGLNELLNIERK